MYNGDCVKSCPENTVSNNYICVVKNEHECTISENQLDNIDLEISKNIENFVKKYLAKYSKRFSFDVIENYKKVVNISSKLF